MDSRACASDDDHILDTVSGNIVDNAVRSEHRSYLTQIVSVVPHAESGSLTGAVRYAREPVPCHSQPVGAAPEWNTLTGEEHRVSFSLVKTNGGIVRSIRRIDVEDECCVDWKPASDNDLRELETNACRLDGMARYHSDINTVSADLKKLRDRMCEMLDDIDRLGPGSLYLVSPIATQCSRTYLVKEGRVDGKG